MRFQPNFSPKNAAAIACLLLACLFSQKNLAAQNPPGMGANQMHAYLKGKTRPLRELAPVPATARPKRAALKAAHPVPPNFTLSRKPQKINPLALPIGGDRLRQAGPGSRTGFLVEPTLLIEGIDEDLTEVGVPDTNGDVSPDHYIEIINASWFQVWAKDGTALIPPTSTNTLWAEIGKSSLGDPVIQYDEAADRWLLTDLANIDEILYAISETSDPMGAWNVYSLNTPGWADYPKYGIWPTAYITTINEGQGAYPILAFNRAQMLAGDAAIDVQRMELPGISSSGFPTATPFDWNGTMPPATGETFVARINDDSWGVVPQDILEVWTFNIDWADASNTNVVLTEIPTAAFDSDGCAAGSFGFECVPQPNTGQSIDGIMTIIMNRIFYRNFGTHESAVLNFSVNAGAVDIVAGIRWVELRRLPGGDWAIFQEGTFAPGDNGHRFMGSIAMNAKGDIALGYSISGTENYPSLRFTGRRASDAPGEMSVDEYEFAPGTGVRVDGNRFGDYSSMTVDPVDDSFWFVGEYVKADNSYGTRIVNFSLRRDTFDIAVAALLSPKNADDLTAQEPVTIVVKNVGLMPATNITVGYVFENQPPVIEAAAVASLAPDSFFTHTFLQKVDMSVIGNYDFKLFAHFQEDQFVGNDTLRQVRRKLPRFDAGVTNITGLDGVICELSAPVGIVVTNFGTAPLTAFSIEHKTNGGPPQTIDWTGNLAPGASVAENITLTTIANGANILTARTFGPNGQADEIPANDGYSRNFQGILNGLDVQLNLLTDIYPDETSWQLLDEFGATVFEGDNYGGQPAELITENWCLEPGKCYTFVIFDNFGDGLNEGDGGSYEISLADGTVVAAIINVDFGYQEDNLFCLELPCALSATASVTDASSTAAADGAILVSVTAGVSPFAYSINGGANFQGNPLFTGLAAGAYPVVVKDAGGCDYNFVAVVKATVATADISKKASISASPNPSADGVFQIKIDGLPMNFQQIDLQVVDAAGRPVLYQNLTGMDGAYIGTLSLHALAAGTYFVRFRNGGIDELLRLVRL